jgi:uncharacterized protein with von Willebrand factor type A (vWA) domain
MVASLAEPLPELDQLAAALQQAALTHAQGELAQRLTDSQSMLAALLSGHCPSDALSAPLQACITTLQLPDYCRGREGLATQVVRTALWHGDHIPTYQDRYGESHAAAKARSVSAFQQEWQSITVDYEAVYSIFEDLGGLASALDPSALNALLKSTAWQAVLAAHALIARLPLLRQLIEQLGRREPLHSLENELAWVTEEQPVLVKRPLPALQAMQHSAGETIGVRRSNEMAAMLASQAIYLKHPLLKKIWRAQFVEQALLSHDRELRLSSPDSETAWEPQAKRLQRPKAKAERGPIIVCVDTSGSMQGGKELIAKACVLEAMRCAHRDQRPCYLYCFSGPENIVEHELALSQTGLEQLSTFLEGSFSGGTDFTEPLTRAIRRVAAGEWQQADILIASDGEFGVVREVALQAIALKAELGLHIASLLIGDRETIGLLEIADEIAWVSNWRDFDPALRGAAQPVHSKSLTKLYFPNALENRSNVKT